MDSAKVIYLVKDINISYQEKAKAIAKFTLEQLDCIEKGLTDYRVVSAGFCLIINNVPEELFKENPLARDILNAGIQLHYLGTEFSPNLEIIKIFSQAIIIQTPFSELIRKYDNPTRIKLIQALERESDKKILSLIYYYNELDDDMRKYLYNAILNIYKSDFLNDSVAILVKILEEGDNSAKIWALERLKEEDISKVLPVLEKIKNIYQHNQQISNVIEKSIKVFRDKSEYNYWYAMFYQNSNIS